MNPKGFPIPSSVSEFLNPLFFRQAAILPLEAPVQGLRGARPANSKVSGGNQVVAVSRSLDDTKTIEQQAWMSYRISEDDDDHRTENMYIAGFGLLIFWRWHTSTNRM